MILSIREVLMGNPRSYRTEVYILYIDVFDCIKIGYSIKIKDRIEVLKDEIAKAYGHEPTITVLKTKLFKDTDSAKAFESMCHELVEDFRLDTKLSFGGKTELFNKSCLSKAVEFFEENITYEYYNPYCALDVTEDEKLRVKEFILSNLGYTTRKPTVRGINLIAKNIKANVYISKEMGVDYLLFNWGIYCGFRTFPSTAFRGLGELDVEVLSHMFSYDQPIKVVKLPDYAFSKVKCPIWVGRFERLSNLWDNFSSEKLS